MGRIFRLVLAGLRTGAVALIAGLLAGMVTGLAARVAMWLVGLSSGPVAAGGPVHTVLGAGRDSAQWTVGALTVGGTLNIVLQAALAGLIGGAMYALSRPWLARFGRWGGIAFGLALLLAFGAVLFNGDPDRREFRHYGTPVLDVALFASLFVIFALGVAFVTDRVDPPPARPIIRSADRAGWTINVLFTAVSYALAAVALLIGLPDTMRAIAAIVAP
jgi:hypothetical protein